jgi:hypothetical protein
MKMRVKCCSPITYANDFHVDIFCFLYGNSNQLIDGHSYEPSAFQTKGDRN